MNFKRFLKTLGPGILFASTAIGVSHLVQSTRAGANYGFQLAWLVLLANLFKYPFFEYGSRYANATGKSIIDGYHQLGKWVLWIYFLITVGSMFFVSAAVGFVTSGFMQNLFQVESSMTATTVVFSVCLGLLVFGKYKLLDSLIKIIGSVLLVSTLAAFVITLAKGPAESMENFIPPVIWDNAGIAFIIALLGWMPTAVDLSAWNSLWTIERIKQTNYKPTLKETLLDFNFGYIVSAILSFCFITLGAYLLYGTGHKMPAGSGGFANEVIHLYTSSIGSWSYIIIASAAFSIMFGTAIAVFDGYARALDRSSELLFYSSDKQEFLLKDRTIYIVSLLIIGVGAYLLIYFFHDQPTGFKKLVDLATTISFLIAPLVAIVNFVLVGKKFVPENALPPTWLKVLSWAGIVFLGGFSLFFLINKLS